MPDQELLAKLQAENARLIALLESRGIEWRPPAALSPPASEPSKLSTGEKVALFRRLFRGRLDVYPIRWESKATGKSGYAPACANEWRAGVCEKPRIKCGDCSNRLLIPLSDAVIYGHLAGEHTVGVYPLMEDDSCYFVAVDFDEAEWRLDARAFMGSCEALGVPAALEISRSGCGAHAWVFFAGRVSARDARRLGTAIISNTCARTRQLKLNSYDRLFPNQDTMPKGGFGNLIALPLQKVPRDKGCSLFVDAALRPYEDQWAFRQVDHWRLHLVTMRQWRTRTRRAGRRYDRSPGTCVSRAPDRPLPRPSGPPGWTNHRMARSALALPAVDADTATREFRRG